MFAFLVHKEVQNVDRRFQKHFFRAFARALFFQLAQNRQRQTVIRADQTSAMAMRAWRGRGFKHTWAQALPAHFQQAKAGNSAHLNAGAIGLKLVFQPFLNGRIVAAFFHVDEIDHDQTSQIAQTQLTRDFFRRFHVGFQRSLFN